MENVLPKEYILTIKYLGYSDLIKNISVSDNIDLNIISLKPSATKLKEVETKAVIATQNVDTTKQRR